MKQSTKLFGTNNNKETIPKVDMDKNWKVGFNPFFYFINKETYFKLVSANNSIVRKISNNFSLWTEIDIEVIPMDSSGTSNVLK